jgi:dihydropteroate synthase
MILNTRAGDLKLSSRVHLMGVLNVTPDSFSDGGKFLSPEAALARAEAMAEEGADIIDVGGESTRPGAPPVPLQEEIRRVVPVVEVLAQRFPSLPISVDTTKAEVARLCLEEGASIINDVSALRFDAGMAAVLREHGVPVILMHMQGSPSDMQDNPAYGDVAREIKDFFQERLGFLADQGLKNQTVLDPGIGFGKMLEHNVAILKNLRSFVEMGKPVLLGTSRKSFLGRLLAEEGRPLPPEEREEATLASGLWAALQGVHILRVHDVRAAARSLKVWRAASGVDKI